MDVDATSFRTRLPDILKHIANAHFLAFDLELSGIPPKKFTAGKPTLQDRYADNKAAAEKFHILQLGITCVEEDAINGCYVIRPYNFNLSPLIGDEFGIERSFAYSASAVTFLLNNGYDMASPFEKGVTYLTRAETVAARQNLMKKFDRDSIPDIIIRAGDEETPKFMARVKSEVDHWQKTRSPSEKALDIRNPNPENARNPLPLDRLQRRLVHQIVRSDFPDLQTASRGDGVLVRVKDPKEAEESRNFTKRRIARDLDQQIGVRWIAEAMTGNYEAARADFELASDVEKSTLLLESNEASKTGANAKSTMPKVLLGHNCFMDLVFVYKLFYGNLPDSLEDFQAAIHKTFPTILDSKYLATETDKTGVFKRLALGELENVISTEGEQPSMHLPTDHLNGASLADEKYHEAGFDSFVTAKVFLRLACRAGTAVPGASANVETRDGDEGWHEATSKSKKKKSRAPVGTSIALADAKAAPTSNSNIYESLSDADMEAAAAELERPATDAEKPVSTSNALRPVEDESAMAKLARDVAALGIGDGSGKLLPRWEDAYWDKYNNRLRVYGTMEEECRLDQPERSAISEAVSPSEATRAPSTIEDKTKSAQGSVRKSSRRSGVFERFKKVLNPFE